MALYIGIKNLIGKGAAWMRSKWTTVVTQLKATFRYRVAGGADNVLLPERNGRAVVSTLYGNTVKWNQLVRNGGFRDGTTNWTAFNSNNISIASGNNCLVATVVGSGGYGYNYGIRQNIIGDYTHLYYVEFMVTIKVGSANKFSFEWLNASNSYSVDCPVDTPVRYVRNHRGTSNSNAFIIKPVVATLAQNDKYEVTGVKVTDLTAIFGTDAEIAAALGISTSDITTATGAAAFENWLALNVGTQDYYPYDEGSLISFKGSALQIKKDGAVVDEVDLSGAYINVWDEQWEIGGINGTSGENMEVSNRFRSTNYIKLPSNRIYIYSQSLPRINLFFYKDDKTYIIYYASRVVNDIIDCPLDAKYIRFCSLTGVTTYNHDICINVSNADINGTYYPHALQSAGNVSDEVSATTTTKRMYEIDLGDLSWKYYDTNGTYFRTDAPVNMKRGVSGYLQVAQCYQYTIAQNIASWSTMQNRPDMSIMCYVGSGYFFLIIKNTSKDGTSVTSSGYASFLKGVKFIYELATPVVVPHDTPMQYAVDKYSTEELLVPASVAGEPTSTAIVADIEYQAK